MKNHTFQAFNPVDYCFVWTQDEWYEWDYEEARRQALRARNARARELRKAGCSVRCFTIVNQLMSRGGVGTQHPHIELCANVYCLEFFDGPSALHLDCFR